MRMGKQFTMHSTHEEIGHVAHYGSNTASAVSHFYFSMAYHAQISNKQPQVISFMYCMIDLSKTTNENSIHLEPSQIIIVNRRRQEWKQPVQT